MLVRLKPYNPRRGHVLRRYTSIGHKIRIRGDRGWYEILEEPKIAFLREICQNTRTEEDNDQLGIDSPLAFDIARDRDHAVKIEASYRARAGRDSKVEVGTADAPVRASRPGRKVVESTGPKKRRRKSANDKVREDTEKTEKTEPSADEIAELRQNSIDDLVSEKTVRELRAMAKGLEVEIPRNSNERNIATLIVDKTAAREAFGDE